MKKMLVFQTDFTYKEGAVAAMYGVVKSVDPDIEIITKEAVGEDTQAAYEKATALMNSNDDLAGFIVMGCPNVPGVAQAFLSGSRWRTGIFRGAGASRGCRRRAVQSNILKGFHFR